MSPGAAAPGLQPLDHVGVAPGGHEADVLAVLLVGDRKAELVRELAHARLRQAAEREAQQVELRARGGEQEIALVAVGIMRAIERVAAVGAAAADHIVAGREHACAEIAGGAEQVGELDRTVALDARHRRLARRIALGETIDHGGAEALFIVEHVVRNADALRDRARIMDVAAGAAGTLAVRGRAVVVELQRDADDVVALGLEQRSRHRGVDAARHGDDDARVLRTAFGVEAVEHGRIPIRRSGAAQSSAPRQFLPVSQQGMPGEGLARPREIQSSR